MKKIPILIDTDIGDDIDDAFAVALAAAIPQADITGVTTVFKNTPLRARQAVKLLRTAGKADVPVFFGERIPVGGVIPLFDKDSGKPEDAVPCQYDGQLDGEICGGGAVDAIIRLAKEHSGELTIVPIGPLTNIARALEKDPSVVCDVKEIVTMGGWFTNCAPEWNILCDPEAAEKVYSSGIPVKAVGLDVTLQCTLDGSLLERFRQSRDQTARLIVRWMDKWFDFFGFEKSVMHDPLAVASVFYDVCRFRDIYVRVITEGGKRGAIETSPTPLKGFYPIKAACEVDKEKFYGIIREKLLSDPANAY